MSVYFTDSELARIKQYKAGRTIDKSLTYKYVISPLCGWLVQFCPSWVAPNVLTLLGLLCNFLGFYLAVTFLPGEADPPKWVYLGCAFFLIAYVLLDNSDGKQAVRTGSSSPLGEALDHGCDSLFVTVGIVTTAYITGVDQTQTLFWGGFGLIAFYLAHWQEYFCHYLELGYLNGPTEAEMAGFAIYLWTFYAGAAWWSTPVTAFGYTFLPKVLVSNIIVLTTVFTIFSTLYKGSVLALERNIKLSKAYSALIPLFSSWMAGFIWVKYTPEVFYDHPQVFLTGVNFLFSYLTINCIVQRMCDLPYRFFYIPTLPLFFGAFNALYKNFTGAVLVDTELLLYVCWVFWLIVLVHFSVTTTNGLCKHLGINALSIPYPNKATKKN